MKRTRLHIAFLFVITALIIFARPLVIFSSPALLHALELEAKTYGVIKAVRKRKETIYTAEEFTLNSEEPQSFQFLPLQLFLSFVRKHLYQLLLLLSVLLTRYLSLSLHFRSYFALVPQSRRHKAVSVFRV